MNCPCCSQKEFEACCGPILGGEKKAATAEELMRARYTAYTRIDMDFVQATHDPKTRKDSDMEANREWAEKTEWQGLEIVHTEAGGREDSEGVVEFKAQYSSGGETGEHHEVSLFNKRKGEWFFSDAKNPDVRTVVNENKVGRNDPCPCGSGKKYKKCCG